MNIGMNNTVINKPHKHTPSNMELSTILINKLIPQRAPFLMVDGLISFDQISTSTEFTVKENNIFYDEGHLSAPGLIENIAQTCAARMGFINLNSGEPVKLGFIGAIRNLIIHRTPIAGEILRTLIIVKEEVFSMTLVDAWIKVGDEVLVEAEMKIALSNINAKE